MQNYLHGAIPPPKRQAVPAVAPEEYIEDPEFVRTVCQQAGVTFEVAQLALLKHSGSIVDAILDLVELPLTYETLTETLSKQCMPWTESKPNEHGEIEIRHNATDVFKTNERRLVTKPGCYSAFNNWST